MKKEYDIIEVESFIISESGKAGLVHIRPLPGQEPFLETMHVKCSKSLSNDFPIGTKFSIRAKISIPLDRKAYISSHYSWPFEVISQ